MVTPNFTPYAEVLVILKRAGESDVDLSKSWSTIEYEDGLPQSCKITLNSAFGQFMTSAPIIVKYDKIFVRITDARDSVIEDVFHVRKIKRGRKIGKNKQLVLFCPHQSDCPVQSLILGNRFSISPKAFWGRSWNSLETCSSSRSGVAWANCAHKDRVLILEISGA